ncbi:maltose acetyltransferase domain-containing protein [Streptomyces sp. NPDC086023]|uniref:maltose acetyltransferase domain-containing protein n=1 Tax=Streptomyces sp. NPDC086023 TaxID=3365746 RepID=UPI0037D3ED72
MGENKRRMLAGDWYLPDDPELAADTRRAAELCAAYNAPGPPPPERRDAILRAGSPQWPAVLSPESIKIASGISISVR